MNGDSLARIAKNTIRKFGQPLTVTNITDNTTQSIYFLPQPMRDSEFVRIGYEGAYNRANPDPHNFVCAGDEDIGEGTHRISYLSDSYQIALSDPQNVGGIAVRIYNVAVRIGPA